MYKKKFDNSNLTYIDVAYALGCCELTARNKINGKTRITKPESIILDKLFSTNTTEGADTTCTISRHNR